MSVIEKVRQHELLRETEAEAAYQRLVVDSWNGRDVDPAEALAILSAAGRDSADLEEDCRALDERDACKKLAAEIPALQGKMEKNRQTLQAARESIEAAQREFSELAKSIEVDNDRLIRRLNECDAAAARLRSEPGLRDEEQHAERQRLAAEQSAVSSALAEAESLARQEQISADQGRERSRLERELNDVRHRPNFAPRSVAEVQRELDGLDAKFAARITRRDQLRERKAEIMAALTALDAQVLASKYPPRCDSSARRKAGGRTFKSPPSKRKRPMPRKSPTATATPVATPPQKFVPAPVVKRPESEPSRTAKRCPYCSIQIKENVRARDGWRRRLECPRCDYAVSVPSPRYARFLESKGRN
jgi:DNA repair exonuclease SbcCD ATPase subunit